MINTLQDEEHTQMLEWAAQKLRDAENDSVSNHTRVEAAFDSIYARLLVSARRKNYVEPAEHPSDSAILLGAVAAGLDDESVSKVLELQLSVARNRYKPGPHSFNLLRAIALGRHIADLVKT